MREQPAIAVHASPNAFSVNRQAVRGLIIGATASVVLALLGALGTGGAPLGLRIAYWAAVILPGSLLGLAVTALVRSWGGFASRLWLEIAIVALLVSLPHSFVVIVVSMLFFGMATITPVVVVQFWLAVLLITLIMTAINYLAHAGAPSASQPAHPIPDVFPPKTDFAPETCVQPEAELPANSGAALVVPSPTPCERSLPPLLAEKLPPRLRQGRLLAIEAEDHYLRIHTDVGSDLLLMRMVDACALLADASGARVHRSWWVARSAVLASEQQAGRMTLTLITGVQVPVSRSMQAQLRKDNWLTQAAG